MRIDPTQSNLNTPAPSNPYHIARAYGVRPEGGAGQVGQSVLMQAAPAVAEQATRQPSAAQALVAAVVPGGVDFQASGAHASRGSSAQPSSSPIQMYRHPADKNAAATAVQVGRRLDITG